MDPLGRRDEMNATEAEDKSTVNITADQGTGANLTKAERFSRLLATRLALEMMLRLRRGRSTRYQAQPTIDVNNRAFYQSMDYIVQELEKVIEIMRSLEIQNVPWNIKMSDEFCQKQQDMALKMTELTNKYKEMEIHLPDYVMSFVQLVTDFKIGLPNQSYVEMMRVLSFHQAESRLARHVEETLYDSHEYLDSYTISNILYHHGIISDSFRFNQFLERLTRADHHPRPRTPWYRVHVNDIDICIPKTKDGHVITALIRTALQCRQQTVAEAYAMVFIDRDRIEKYSGIHKWFILSNFLQSYGNWMSWESGRKWLQYAVSWLSELAASEEHVLGRVILRMLDFCVACGKHDDYEAIMRAVVAANMLIPALTPDAKVQISARMNAIRRDWAGRIKAIDQEAHSRSDSVSHEQLKIFASLLDGRWTPNSKSSQAVTHQPDTGWKEQGYLAYNPVIAAQRLEQASKQRQRTVNHGFKKFERSRGRVLFPPSGEQNTLSHEPMDDDMPSNPQSDEFASPFFQPVQQEVSSSRNTRNPKDAPNNADDMKVRQVPSNRESELQGLQRDYYLARRRLKETEDRRNQEIEQMRRELETVRLRLEEAQSVRISPAEHDDDEAIKSSASG